MERGGFDCILGNPPYLGGQKLSGTYGHAFCEFVKWNCHPTGLSELVVFFLRRAFGLVKDGGYVALITTNSIRDGDIRRDGLEQVLANGGTLNMAVRGIKWPGRANLVVSLLAMRKGECEFEPTLDGKTVGHITPYLDDAAELGEPKLIAESRKRLYQGATLVGDGFLLNPQEAKEFLDTDGRNADVIRPCPKGKEDINNHPDQEPSRWVINFWDYPLTRASEYPGPFERVKKTVKQSRQSSNREAYREKWWIYGGRSPGLVARCAEVDGVFVLGTPAKHLTFSRFPSEWVFTNICFVLTNDRWDLFAVVQSTLHEVWARKYSGSLETRLRYSPSKCFDTFAFPAGLWQTADPGLAERGERYHAHRKALMHSLWLGLTKIYNLFHARDASPEMVAKVSKKDTDTAASGFDSVLELRRLHVALDVAVRDAYGWYDLDLEHDFHEVETLPENDRIRYTISPDARREVLKRLLAENHARAHPPDYRGPRG